MPEAEVRVPCPRCGAPIIQGARKCPKCRAYLDPQLVADRRLQIQEMATHAVESHDLMKASRATAIGAGIGAVILPFIGPIFGPITLGYALVYQARVRRLQIPTPTAVRFCFGLGGLWILTSAIFFGLIWWLNSQ